jgi:hypothetical protein
MMRAGLLGIPMDPGVLKTIVSLLVKIEVPDPTMIR